MIVKFILNIVSNSYECTKKRRDSATKRSFNNLLYYDFKKLL